MDTPDGGPPELADLEPPVAQPVVSLAGPPVTPEQRIFFYSSDEWEMFIREWATGVAEQYVQIKRLGGPNDRGVDVAGFKTNNGFEGAWDCFQAKHYAKALTLSDVVPEMLKIFIGVIEGHYGMPDRYMFLAPRGCGPTLNRLLSKPTELRETFLDHLEPGSASISTITPETVQAVRDLANSTDFSVFQSVELADALDVHRTTRHFAGRFGGPLPKRPPVPQPPDSLAENETRYARKLFDTYAETNPPDPLDEAALSSHPQFGKHFQRQRVSFYSAEALRLYARDSVPYGTFEALQDDVHGGVVEVADANHASGMDRLQEVLSQSTQLDLSSHALISVARHEDRKGICHQLANDDRLTWVCQTS